MGSVRRARSLSTSALLALCWARPLVNTPVVEMDFDVGLSAIAVDDRAKGNRQISVDGSQLVCPICGAEGHSAYSDAVLIKGHRQRSTAAANSFGFAMQSNAAGA